jgi:anti-sigma-K factor RskA
MADTPLSLAEERDLLAAELALGVLEGEDRAEALRLQLSDAGFAAAVEAWHAQLAPLTDALPPVEPSTGVWTAIQRRLEGAATEGAAPAPNVTDIGSRVRPWQWSTAAATALAACLALVVVLRPAQELAPTPTPAPTQFVDVGPAGVAQLASAEGEPLLAVSYDEAGSRLRVRALRLDPKAETAPELWIIPGDGTPRSLGLIRADGTSEVTLPPGSRDWMGQQPVLAVTYEPRATAPHQAPSSDIVASGKVLTI